MSRPGPDTRRPRLGGREAGGGLTFVNLSHPAEIRDRRTQTEIRRHVMRDIGKARRRRPRPGTVSLAPPEGDEQEAPAPGGGWDAARYAPLTPSRAPRGFYPVEPDSRALELVHFVYAEGDYIHCPFRAAWIRIALCDAGPFNLFLAYAVFFIKKWQLVADPDLGDDAESGQYYSRALTRLTQQLGDRAERVSAGAIATVLGLLCQGFWDIGKTDWARWSMHMDGLVQMWTLRGGFAGLEDDIPMMAFWMDVVGAALFNRPPRFPWPEGLPDRRAPPPGSVSPPLRQLCDRLRPAFPQLGPTAHALRLMAGIADHVNRHSHQRGYWRASFEMVKMLGSAAHYILSAASPPAGAPGQVAGAVPAASVVAEAVRLACLMLLGGLKARASLPAPELGSLQERFASLLEVESAPWTPDLADLHLWALVTAALQSRGAGRRLLTSGIREAVGACHLADARDAVWRARDMLWIHALEAEQAADLLDELSAIHLSA